MHQRAQLTKVKLENSQSEYLQRIGERFLKRHYSSLWNDFQDLINQALEVFLSKQNEDIKRPESFFLGILSYKARTTLNKKRKDLHVFLPNQDLDILPTAKESEPDSNDSLPPYIRQHLTQNQALVIQLYFYMDFSVQEITTATSLSTSAVYRLKSEALQRLRENFSPTFNGSD